MDDKVKAELLCKMERRAALLPTPARHDPSTLRAIAHDVTAPLFDHAYSIHRQRHASLTDEFLERLRTCASTHRRDTLREEYRLYRNQWSVQFCALILYTSGGVYLLTAGDPNFREWRFVLSAGYTLLGVVVFLHANGWPSRRFLEGHPMRFNNDYQIFVFNHPVEFASAQEHLIHRIERRLATLDSPWANLRELERVVREEIAAFPKQSSLPTDLGTHLTARAVAEIQSPPSFARRKALRKEYQRFRILLITINIGWCLIFPMVYLFVLYLAPTSHARIFFLLVGPVFLYMIAFSLRQSPSETFRGVQKDLFQSDLIWIENTFRSVLSRFSAKRIKSQAGSTANDKADDSSDSSH